MAVSGSSTALIQNKCVVISSFMKEIHIQRKYEFGSV
jgi:hypothetical protein